MTFQPRYKLQPFKCSLPTETIETPIEIGKSVKDESFLFENASVEPHKGTAIASFTKTFGVDCVHDYRSQQTMDWLP